MTKSVVKQNNKYDQICGHVRDLGQDNKYDQVVVRSNIYECNGHITKLDPRRSILSIQGE